LEQDFEKKKKEKDDALIEDEKDVKALIEHKDKFDRYES